MYQDELAARITRAGDEGPTTLDLSSEGMEYLPPEIGNLTGLTGLDLSRNRLTALPPEIGNLTGLTELRLMNNQLTGLPLMRRRLLLQGVVKLSGNPFNPSRYRG